MDERDPGKEAQTAIIIMDRRTQRESDLSSADVMKILRKRAAKALRRGNGSSGESNGAG